MKGKPNKQTDTHTNIIYRWYTIHTSYWMDDDDEIFDCEASVISWIEAIWWPKTYGPGKRQVNNNKMQRF